ncbi:MAG: glycosyltransferase [Flavobacteriales bacterium]
MKLSVIIVNYNVKAYLEQCLRTVFEALKGMEGDVFVVDNLSTDGSVEMVREKFPQVKLIANQDNVGFSRANNQAIRESNAEYAVLLNPDTVVGEDVFRKVVAFMDADPNIGGLGVKMIDGTGRFLPESKRGLPTPAVAFYKIIGLARLFPRSRIFGRYHLGHLPENEAAPIEILSGACMFLRKETLDKVGLLDENFFMYGEDIDLSYRITLGGYANWYFPDARIIHYKGESTKKSSVNYVFVFYNAMAIFARKHFTRRGPQFFSFLIRAAIYLSAAAAIVSRFLRGALLPMLDLLITATGLLLVENTLDHGGLPWWSIVAIALPVLGVLALFGAYDRPVRVLHVAKGMLFLAVISVWITYMRGAWGHWLVLAFLLWGLALIGLRFVLHLLRAKDFGSRTHERVRVLSIGSVEENARVLALLWQTHFGLGREVTMDANSAAAADGTEAIKKAIKRQGLDEVVFCASDISWERIILLMERLSNVRATFKIAQPGSEFIIGPSTTESLQDLLVLREHAVSSAGGRRTKRVLDITIALSCLVTLPIGLLIVHERAGFVRNIFRVLNGDQTWVGYLEPGKRPMRLPRLRECVLDIVHADGMRPVPLVVRRMNLEYAKDYRAWRDLRCVVRNFPSLGGAQSH